MKLSEAIAHLPARPRRLQGLLKLSRLQLGILKKIQSICFCCERLATATKVACLRNELDFHLAYCRQLECHLTLTVWSLNYSF